MGPSENGPATTGVEQARTLFEALALSHNVYKYNAEQPQETADNITVMLGKREKGKWRQGRTPPTLREVRGWNLGRHGRATPPRH